MPGVPTTESVDLTAARRETVSTLGELEAISGRPAQLSVDKVQDHLSPRMMAFICHAPLYLLATASGDGICDVSPRGDPAGSVLIADARTLVLPDRQGNNRVDSLRNLIANPSVGLLFLVPGSVETLRVNGAATISRHQPLLERMTMQGKVPRFALIVDIAEAYMHCGRAFKRSNLWDPAGWPQPDEVPTMAAILQEQLDMPGDLRELERERSEKYDRTLY